MFGAKSSHLNNGIPIWATANETLNKLVSDNVAGDWLLAMDTNSRILILYKVDMTTQNGILYWTLMACETEAKFVSEFWFLYDTVRIITVRSVYLVCSV